MKIRLFISLAIFMAVSIGASIPAAAGDHRNSRHGPRKNMVWEAEIPISEDVIISGFWRPRARNGYRWIEAVQDDAGRWDSGYWVPINAHRMTDQMHFPGYWGPKNREGFLWLNQEDRAGEYPNSSWKKMNSHKVVKPPLQWVRGYWNGRRWMDGYWRLPKKDGHIWVEGYYNSNGR
jgi:hypothetical protein